MLRLLPWEYGVRNLFRRPGRTALTVAALTLVLLMVFAALSFIRGLSLSLSISADPRVVLIHSVGGGENLESSSIPARSASLVSASVRGIQRRFGQAYVSPELHLTTRVYVDGDDRGALGVIRGVAPAVLLVRQQVQLIEGQWPQTGEVAVGRLAAVKLGRPEEALAVGQTVMIEGRRWRVSGRFAAVGSALEAEIWGPLDEFQQALKRQDLSLLAVTLGPGGEFGEIDEFCKERLDLELQATPETFFYGSLQAHYRPIRLLIWCIVALVGGAGVFAGLNTMYANVLGRVRELAMLQTLGYSRTALVLSVIQEGMLIAAISALTAAAAALLVIDGTAIRFTMGAFVLRTDAAAILAGCAVAMVLGVVGALTPALRVMRMPIGESLKAI